MTVSLLCRAWVRVVYSVAVTGVLLALFALAGYVEGGCGGQC
jgi:hypothetical protein